MKRKNDELFISPCFLSLSNKTLENNFERRRKIQLVACATMCTAAKWAIDAAIVAAWKILWKGRLMVFFYYYFNIREFFSPRFPPPPSKKKKKLEKNKKTHSWYPNVEGAGSGYLAA